MDILGISAFYHDSAACLVRDGRIVAAAQEERFTRKKHDPDFPKNAVAYCLKTGGIQASGLDMVGFYDKPILKFDRLLQTYLAYAPRGFESFRMAIPLWVKEKLWMRDLVREALGYAGKVHFLEHHESHAASAFFPSPFQESAILTMDGVGEWATSSIGRGSDNKVSLLKELHFPHSLGMLYSAFTYYTGFKVNSGEYKVMGLAPYGEPKHVAAIYEELLDLKADGSFKLNMEYFDYCAGLTMTNKKFDRLFGGPPREPESKLTQREMDLARSVQEVCEEVMRRMARRGLDAQVRVFIKIINIHPQQAEVGQHLADIHERRAAAQPDAGTLLLQRLRQRLGAPGLREILGSRHDILAHQENDRREHKPDFHGGADDARHRYAGRAHRGQFGIQRQRGQAHHRADERGDR